MIISVAFMGAVTLHHLQWAVSTRFSLRNGQRTSKALGATCSAKAAFCMVFVLI
jgi:hypothetical protein